MQKTLLPRPVKRHPSPGGKNSQAVSHQLLTRTLRNSVAIDSWARSLAAVLTAEEHCNQTSGANLIAKWTNGNERKRYYDRSSLASAGRGDIAIIPLKTPRGCLVTIAIPLVVSTVTSVAIDTALVAIAFVGIAARLTPMLHGNVPLATVAFLGTD
ncbi:hypothetical protein WJX77_007818 [Trebouxia sp. C0004]